MLAMPLTTFLACFAVLWDLPRALQLHRDAGTSVGEEIGSQVRTASDEISADEQQNVGKSDFQDAYVKSLTEAEAVIVNPEVSKVIRKSNMLVENLEPKDGVCERHWAASCPEGWMSNDAGTCAAPASYRGPCAKKAERFDAVISKRRFAETCHAAWPCDDECTNGRDYSMTCPQRWEDTGGGFCSAPAGFRTKCATLYDFAEMETSVKQELAATCGFSWPCKMECAQDYSKSCPEDWSEVPMNPGFCTAPPTYAGICSYGVNTTTMTLGQKRSFARKCGVQFPCASSIPNSAGALEPQSFLPDGPIDASGNVISSGDLISHRVF